MPIITRSTPMPPSGSEISSMLDASRLATLTNETSATCSPVISPDTPNAISSPASVDGRLHCASLAGLTTDLFGRALALASPTARPLEDATFARISGLSSGASSWHVALTDILASRLMRRGLGWMASALIWKEWVTPSGRRFYRLTVSVKTMAANGFSLKATPTAKANQDCPSMRKWPGCRGIEVSPEAWCQRMGYPIEWLSCAPLATPSSPSSPRRSSRPADK